MNKKLLINTEVIQKFNPCLHRFDNWKDHYDTFNGDVLKFLALPNITPIDKIWVALRVLPRDLVEIFAIDCALKAVITCADIAVYTTAVYPTADSAVSDYAHAAAHAAAHSASVAVEATNALAAAHSAEAAAYADAAVADAVIRVAACSYANAYDAAARNDSLENSVDALTWLIMDARNARGV